MVITHNKTVDDRNITLLNMMRRQVQITQSLLQNSHGPIASSTRMTRATTNLKDKNVQTCRNLRSMSTGSCLSSGARLRQQLYLQVNHGDRMILSCKPSGWI